MYSVAQGFEVEGTTVFFTQDMLRRLDSQVLATLINSRFPRTESGGPILLADLRARNLELLGAWSLCGSLPPLNTTEELSLLGDADRLLIGDRIREVLALAKKQEPQAPIVTAITETPMVPLALEKQYTFQSLLTEVVKLLRCLRKAIALWDLPTAIAQTLAKTRPPQRRSSLDLRSI